MLYEIIGKAAMLEQTAEEAAELAQACLKLARYERIERGKKRRMLERLKEIDERRRAADESIDT